MRVDVLILGGGASGLWCLDRFRRAGYHAILLEAKALGAGQTIQAQGIIHGGGKYALRGVRDFAAVRATSEMPARWRACLAGASEPSLAGADILSQQCHLWLPRNSLMSKVQSWGFLSVVARAGLLATKPVRLDKHLWPALITRSAVAVYTLNEQVISTGSFLKALAAIHEQHIFLYDAANSRFRNGRLETGDISIAPRATVLAAGAGNEELLRRAGLDGGIMQRRPLTMVLLRGTLPPFFGHCVVGGKTQLTITTPTAKVWQIGGELAERLSHEDNSQVARSRAFREIQRWIPGLDLSDVEIALYYAERAEARTTALRRPSGVHARYVGPRLLVAWPTKLCLTPVLADEVFSIATAELRAPAGYDLEASPSWPKPALASYPWEAAEWSREI
jgi:glycine/D-amino acid oxidase-like deaminating enzyme